MIRGRTARGILSIVFLIVFFMALAFFTRSIFALQRYTLLPEEGHGEFYQKMEGKQHGKTTAEYGMAVHGARSHQAPAKTHEQKSVIRHEATMPVIGEKRSSLTHQERLKTFMPATPRTGGITRERHAPETQQPAKATHAPPATMEHGTEVMAEHEEDHVVLPKISPIPGVTFVETMIKLMEHELKGRFLGWRPNDLIIGRFTDNVNNFQLGVLEAMRFTTLRLKDSLTRMGEADAYDRDLESALNLLMNKATEFWFPSAESSYSEAVDHLKKFLKKLKTGERRFYYRTDNLLALIVSYSDLLGNVNRTLIMDKHADGRPVSWFETDDYFYYAKGVAHVMYEILKVVRVGFKEQLATIDAVEIMDHILHELHRAEKMDPWIVLDSDLDGLFANHRANLNAPLSEVTHLMSVMSRF